MTRLMQSSVQLADIVRAPDPTATAGSLPSITWPQSRRSSGLTGLTSGNPQFDTLLDRLHVAFGALQLTSDGAPYAVAEAANDLSVVYTTITGRRQPEADTSAGALALTVQRGLSALPTSLTDPIGQTMLRLL